MENMEKKMNWGTLVLGIIIGAVVVGVVWAASKPATSQGQGGTAQEKPLVFGNCLEVFGGGVDCTVLPQAFRAPAQIGTVQVNFSEETYTKLNEVGIIAH